MPTRRVLQIHLSTAILLMIAAGSLLRANTLPVTINRTSDGDLVARGYGWPLAYTSSVDSAFGSSIKLVTRLKNEAADPGLESKIFIFTIDAVVAMAILFVLAWLAEFVIRRREARK